jgi:signal transduction histidine kinase
LKKYEIESLLKNFLLFFLLLELLASVIVWQQFNDEKRNLNDQIQTKMKLCSYSMKCDDFSLDFVPLPKGKEINHLYVDSDLYSYFTVPTVDKYMMQVILDQKKYEVVVNSIRNGLLLDMLIFSIFIMIVSLLFSLYALKPLKKALNLNEEFVKDILHDFNTPISSMVINFKLLKKESGENKKINRLENNIETILTLQKNLQTFLKGINTQKESFSLNDLLKNRIQYFSVLYPDISYSLATEDIQLHANKDAFTRIIDNILSNAGKYNIVNGTVILSLDQDVLSIKDSGIGIINPSKIFERFYKEQDRGIGIGMHIVKKLCDELSIKIKIESKEKNGTRVILDLSEVILK